jgi:hypothetical protein
MGTLLKTIIFPIIILFLVITDSSWSEDSPIKRADLIIPPDLWSNTCSRVGYADRPLGYSRTEMANFPDHPYKLRQIANLFDDVRKVPRFSGLLSDRMLENRDKVDKLVTSCYGLLDSSAGRGLEIPSGDKWGSKLIADGTYLDDAFLRIVIQSSYKELPEVLEKWKLMPDGYKRFILRMIIASYEATPIVQKAYDKEFILKSLKLQPDSLIDRKELYKLVSTPFNEDYSENKNGIDAFEKIDMNYLAYGSVLYFTHVQNAIDELKAWLKDNDISANSCPSFEIESVIGRVCIIGSIDQSGKPVRGKVDMDCKGVLIIDIQSNSNYRDNFELQGNFSHPITAIVDLKGDDRYGSPDENAKIGCGLFGINAIFDFDGSDVYECSESGIGCAWYGTGLVMDYTGDDKYLTRKSWGQGAAHAGVGILVDLDGNDEYIYGDQSQGLGSTLGVGLLLDNSGNDKYLHTDEVRKIALETERAKEPAASLSQGCGFGRRADFGDGHSLAGGFGILIDAQGDDEYEGRGRFAQGTGYWWGMGIFEDYGGDDKYIGYWYAQGASAHFGIGSFVDLTGNDIYNDEYAKSQFLGNGRDGSLAVFFDGEGNDYYAVTNRSAGEGDLNGIGLFWDRCGDDYYKVQTCEVMKQTPVIGAATTESGLERTFRETMPSVGVFIDSGGNDTYDGTMYVDQYVKDRKLLASSNSEWWHNEGPVLWGYGIDLEL